MSAKSTGPTHDVVRATPSPGAPRSSQVRRPFESATTASSPSGHASSRWPSIAALATASACARSTHQRSRISHAAPKLQGTRALRDIDGEHRIGIAAVQRGEDDT